MAWFDRDRLLIAAIDNLTGEAARKAGSRLTCHAGCSPCCFGPFAITPLDAWRLRRGLRALETVDPGRAAGIRRRAAAAVQRQTAAFPADAVGTFATPADEEAFYGQFASDPCPALSPDRGTCELYAARPICCRTYGPPVRIGGDDLPPCPLCFKGAAPDQIEAARQPIDVEDVEHPLVAEVAEATGRRGMTTIAFAIGLIEPMNEARTRGGAEE